MAALDWAKAEGGVERIVWKTTTKTSYDFVGAPPVRLSDWEWLARQEALVVAAFENRSWPILDAAGATKELLLRQLARPEEKDKIWVDAVHFTGSIYRALNEMLYALLCNE